MRHSSRLPFVTDTACELSDRQRIRDLALQHDLNYYDASYLELALRHQAPLTTCDRHLSSLKESRPALFPSTDQ
jgi:predicted nucleic acid-binding protein